MSIFDRLRARKAPPPASLDVDALLDHFGDAAKELEHTHVDPALVRARLADGFRDAGLDPAPPAAFEVMCADLDDAAWRRMAVAVSALELEEVQAALPKLIAGRRPEDLVREAFAVFAQESRLLTMALMRQSSLRTEEFTRLFVAASGAGVEGETAAESQARLERVDYARLLAQAESARSDAEERMKYLRKLQQEQERRFAPRGKW